MHGRICTHTRFNRSTCAGAGKTLIAVLLVKDKAGGLDRHGVKKVSVFLAPKVDLVLQVRFQRA